MKDIFRDESGRLSITKLQSWIAFSAVLGAFLLGAWSKGEVNTELAIAILFIKTVDRGVSKYIQMKYPRS
ncbi:MAG: hypothetical protein ACE5LX_01430 [Nitrospinota bacterium]